MQQAYGKTYHMLDLARELKKTGVDVVIGYIEKHDRKETLALLDGFEMLPTKDVKYKNVILNELDIKKVLERKPDIAIVDELAHTNANGLSNKKRYEDIEELLEAGIDVYTTLNIQHIESLKQRVREITNIRVMEIVPDEIIKQADNIEMIDIEPIELLNRIKEGKVYKKDKIEDATNNFFTLDNLTKLREIALQYMVDSLDRKNITISLKEEILVYLDISYRSIKVIEKAYALATSLHVNWSVLVIQNNKDEKINMREKENLKKLQQFVKKLNGKWIMVQRKKKYKEMKNYLEDNKITQIILGKELIYKHYIRFILLLKVLKNKDIYLI